MFSNLVDFMTAVIVTIDILYYFTYSSGSGERTIVVSVRFIGFILFIFCLIYFLFDLFFFCFSARVAHYYRLVRPTRFRVVVLPVFHSAVTNLMFAIYNRDKIRARCLIRFSTRLVVGGGAPIITSFRYAHITFCVYIYVYGRYG